jgi:hypothetical protein
MRAVKNFTNVSVSAKMRLTSISALKKPSKEASNAIKFYENGHQKYEKGVRFCVTHLNISAAHPLWRYRKRGFGVLGGPKRAKNRVRRDVSVSAKTRLTSKAQRQFQSLPAARATAWLPLSGLRSGEFMGRYYYYCSVTRHLRGATGCLQPVPLGWHGPPG